MKMSGYEVDDAVEDFESGDAPNLYRATRILQELMWWTNRNSDGWSYWSKPGAAADKLQDLIQQKQSEFRHGGGRDAVTGKWVDASDLTDAELSKALTPIKGFCTKQQKETSHRDRSKPRMTQAERDDILLAGSKRKPRSITVNAIVAFDYEVTGPDGLIRNAEEAQADVEALIDSGRLTAKDFTFHTQEDY